MNEKRPSNRPAILRQLLTAAISLVLVSSAFAVDTQDSVVSSSPGGGTVGGSVLLKRNHALAGGSTSQQADAEQGTVVPGPSIPAGGSGTMGRPVTGAPVSVP